MTALDLVIVAMRVVVVAIVRFLLSASLIYILLDLIPTWRQRRRR